MISVFTPTYNRVDKLQNLYESLKKQSYFDFEWLVIDDGSTDDTLKYLKEIQKEKKIVIQFETQPNSGKHIAFNKGIELARGDIFICVDSDDTLTPDALEKIHFYAKKYEKDSSICGFCFLKGYDEKHPVTSRYKAHEFRENYNEYIINKGFSGDKCEVFYTRILKKYSFPKLGNEKFLAEGFLWSRIGKSYDYIFIDEIIYLCEYLEGGLSKSGRSMRIRNPYAGMYHAYEYLDTCYSIKVREKNALLFLTYARFSKQPIFKIIKEKKHPLLLGMNFLPSFILYKYWQKKYM